MKISALIHTRNEAENLPDCLASVAWCDEVIVADMESSDETRDIAAGCGARVVAMPLEPIVERVRNRAVAECLGDWVLVVDADERVPPGLADALRKSRWPDAVGAVAIPRKNYFLGEWLEHGLWPDHQIRFCRRGAVQWSPLIHEHPSVAGVIEFLPADPAVALEHPGYVRDLGAFLEKRLRYSRMDAERLAVKLKPAPWPWLVRRPLGEFHGRYFRAGAWRHGGKGLLWSLAMAMYELQVAMHYWQLRQATCPDPTGLKIKVRVEGLRSMWKWLRG